MWSIYTMKYCSVIRKDEYPTFASVWVELEGVMLNEVIQAKKVSDHMVSLTCVTEGIAWRTLGEGREK